MIKVIIHFALLSLGFMVSSKGVCQDPIFQAGDARIDNYNVSSLEPVDSPTLHEAIRIALANNPGIIAVANETEASGYQVNSLKSERLPSVDVLADYQHYLYEQRVVQARKPRDWNSPFTKDIASLDVIITVPLYTFGRLSNNIKAVELLHKASLSELSHTESELIFNVSSLYYSILAQHHIVSSIDVSKQAISEHLATIHQMIEVKKAATVDRLRAEVRLSDLEQQHIQETNVLSIEYSALSNLLGLDAGQGIQSLEDSLRKKDVMVCPTISDCYSRALDNRDDYSALLTELDAENARIQSTEALRYPSIYLKGSYTSRLDVLQNDKTTVSDPSYFGDDGMVGVILSMPLFDGGNIDSQIQQQHAEYNAKKQRIRELELKIYNEVHTSRLNLESAQKRIDTTQKSIEEARESLRIEQEKYRLGSGTVVDVLDAQSALLQAQNNYFRALADWNISLAQVRYATGESEIR